tara:strand:+ start:2419 stop:3405 length:987 start_codon:yes stop_codon:yes gene_type:complete
MPRKTGKSPSFHMYAGDFLSDMNVKLMNMTQRGIYITLLLHEWIEGSIPSNMKHLKKLCEDCKDFEKHWKMVSPCFYEENGKMYNPRLEEERANMLADRERKSKNGKKGAMKRWHSNSTAIAQPSNSNKEIEIEKEIEINKNKKTISRITLNKEFENEFWTLYPRRDNKKRANDKYVQLRKAGATKDDILNGLKGYIKQWKISGTEPEYIPMASTWLHQERFKDELITNTESIKMLKHKKEYKWMCKECGSEKTTQEDLAGKFSICECGDGYWESRNSVLQQLAIEKDAKSRQVLRESGNDARTNDNSSSKKDINSLVSNLTKSFGVR